VSAWKEFQLGRCWWSRWSWCSRWSCCRSDRRARRLHAGAQGLSRQALLMLLFLLPLMVPPITYGIPLATVMYQLHLAGTLAGRDHANMIPALPFVILVMTPFIEQIDTNLESAARVFGANTGRCSARAGAAAGARRAGGGLLVLVRTVAMFELTFLVAGARHADAGGGAVLRGVRGRRARRAVGGCDGHHLHGDHAGVAADRAALRQPDAAGEPRQRTSVGGNWARTTAWAVFRARAGSQPPLRLR
jgi:hypothetical protein